MFVASGYPEEITRKFLNKWKAKAVSQTEKVERTDTLYLPYIRELSERVERTLKDLKIRTVFKGASVIIRKYFQFVKT